jgi:4-amino-4-deoxy-L-arabinose transferase-like glycosyltransferase
MTRARERVVEALAAAAVTALLLYPISRHPASLARIDSSDGQFSIWNVAWVARTIVADPRHLFDANIFYPHRGALLYSEANLVAGTLAAPGYWITGNPYFAHNSVVLFSFFLSALGAYWLVRALTNDRWAGAVAGICFAFTPHLFAHTTHIQLLMTPGIPLTMLAFHRMADRPTRGRGAMLGVAMAATAFSCAYYGIFVIILVAIAVFVTAAMRRWWTNGGYWSAILTGAIVALAIVLPLFVPYALREQSGGFTRSLNEARRYSGDWHSYLASAARAHTWMLPLVRPWRDVAFPGFVAAALGLGRLVTAFRLRGRSAVPVVMYSAITFVSFWASLGPDAGLYSVLYNVMPGFSLMRAPIRFALPVAFGLSVLAGLAVHALLPHVRRPAIVGASLVALAIADHSVSLRFPTVPPPPPAYEALARLPRAPVIEMPFFERPAFYSRHTIYMLMSTLHWMPLVNGYSDYTPPEFEANARDLAPFPFPPAFAAARRLGVRYAMFHLSVYDAKTRAEVEERLLEFAPYLRPMYIDADTRLYEIAGFP